MKTFNRVCNVLLGSKDVEHANYKQYLKKLILENISDVVSSRPAATA